LPRTMNEIGTTGARKYQGVFSEEFLKELRGAKGIETYREMAENDDVCSAILYAIETLIRQSSWRVQAAGDTPIDQEAAEFVESCMDDMQDTWTDTISEILSFLTFGWSYHEIVYKRRMGNTKDPRTQSKFSDGLIGWAKLPIRAQETLFRWEYDDNDNLRGMTQAAPPLYQQVTIPIEKALHFRTKSRKGNPEGRSILRGAFRPWYFKRRIQEIEGMGIERDLAGFPVLYAPEKMNIWDTSDPEMQQVFARAETIVRNVRRDAAEGLVLPKDWEFTLVSSGSRRQFDTNQIIERYDTRIAMSTMSDFLLLGHQQVGSFALSSDKTELFSMALGAYLDIICEVFNSQGIPRLMQMNADHFNGITDYPRLEHGDVESPDLVRLSTFIKDMTFAGTITPDEDLEDYLREVAHLPERTESQQFDETAPGLTGDQEARQRQRAEMRERRDTRRADNVDLDDNDETDDIAAKAARKALGRDEGDDTP
jgi:hypothetical protein